MGLIESRRQIQIKFLDQIPFLGQIPVFKICFLCSSLNDLFKFFPLFFFFLFIKMFVLCASDLLKTEKS